MKTAEAISNIAAALGILGQALERMGKTIDVSDALSPETRANAARIFTEQTQCATAHLLAAFEQLTTPAQEDPVSLPCVPNWIHVDTALPETLENVLMWARLQGESFFRTHEGFHSAGFWRSVREHDYQVLEITHWAPLPAFG